MGVSSSNKIVLFRVDSNKTIASGHVMRCLSLADALRLEGAQCVFASSDGDMAPVIMDRGHSCINLHSRWDNLDADFPAIDDLLNEIRPHFIMVDTYSATEKYIARLSRYCPVGYLGSKRLASDGLSLLVNYSTEIDYDFYEKTYDSRKTRLLLGPQYAPLRSQFWNVPRKRCGDVKSVLITLGNSANRDFLERLLRSISSCQQLELVDFKLLVGRYFEHADWLKTYASQRKNISLLSDVLDMATLMSGSDIAVSACGTTVYELGACSVPTIGFALVKEQASSAESLARLNAIAYAGTAFDDPSKCANNVVDLLCVLANDDSLRKTLSHKINEISDGEGVRRIVQAIYDLIGVEK